MVWPSGAPSGRWTEWTGSAAAYYGVNTSWRWATLLLRPGDQHDRLGVDERWRDLDYLNQLE